MFDFICKRWYVSILCYLSFSTQAYLQLNNGDSLMTIGQYDKAYEAFTRRKAENPLDTTAWQKSIVSAYHLGYYRTLKEEEKNLLSLRKWDVSLIACYAQMYEQEQNIPKAIKYYLKLDSIYSHTAQYKRKVGLLYQQIQLYTDATYYLEEAYSAHPHDMLSIALLAQLYFDQNDIIHCDSIVAQGLRLDSTHVGLQLLKSKVYFYNKQYGDVVTLLDSLTHITELPAYYYKILGYSLIQIDEIPQAIFYLQKALHDAQQKEYIYFYLGLAHEKSKLWSDARFYYNKAIESAISPEIHLYYRGIARIAMQNNTHKEAISAYKKALQYNDDPIVYYYLGAACESYYSSPKAAIEYYAKFIDYTEGRYPTERNDAQNRLIFLKEKAFMKNRK